jgi:hypothetical protein
MRVFCSKCHQLTATIVRDGDYTKVLQNGKAVLNIRGETKLNKFSVNCPHGHSVRIDINGNSGSHL